MERRKFPWLAALVMGFSTTTTVAATETLIPRSMAGDKGRYYLLEAVARGSIVRTLHKRVGVDSVGYTRAEVDCSTKRMRELGYSETAPEDIRETPTKWFDLVPGSSKSDLATFVCRR